MVKIEFTKSEGDLVFVDSIVLPDDHSFTNQQIEDIKADRFSTWLKMRVVIDENTAPTEDQ
jgi:hypothetical protein